MKLFSLYRVEFHRLLLSKNIWAAVALCLSAPVLGYISDVYGGMSDIYIAAPVLMGTSAGAVVWAVITILETSRLKRSSMEVLTDAAASPLLLSAARIFAMLTVSAAATAVCALLYLPYTAVKMEYLFDPGFYFANFIIFMMPTWWISVLFAEGFYQITCRIELSVLLYALSAYFSFSSYVQDDYFMRWINPKVIVYSDGFMSWWPLRMGLYTRLMWLCISAGMWLLSLLCIRKYEKNLAVSFLRGMKKAYLPLAAVLFAGTGAVLFIRQPFIDHGPPQRTDEDSYIETPTTKTNGIRYFLTAKPVTGELAGRAEFDIEKPYTGEDKFMLNPGYQIKSMTYGGQDIEFRTQEDDLNGVRSTSFTLPDLPGETLVVEYGGMPALERAFAHFNVSESVDMDYISLGIGSLVPIFNYECEEGANFSVTMPDTLTPYLNRVPMTEYTDNSDGTKTWSSQADDIYSLRAGNYRIDTFEAAGTQIDFVYGKAYEEPVEAYDARQSVVDVFEYCTKHYGRLGYVQDEKLILQQASSALMGGHAGEGYVEWFENVLSPLTLSDSSRGANATEVFIHEMIHQWWGGYGLECDMEDDRWSDEGLTVYAAYRLVKEKYGALYAKQYYTDKWRKAVKEQNRNFYNRHPEYLDRLPEKYRIQLANENSSINMYMRMPLMILRAEELLGGEENMDKVLQKMFADRDNYREYPYFTYEDFLYYCALTKEDLELE